MAFPQTRLTLIQRLATGGRDTDWSEFLEDYWVPVCRFTQRTGNLSAEDAEDIAAQVFQALLKNRLLERWSQLRSAKLRTLICSVVRKTISTHVRVQAGRARLVRDHGGKLARYPVIADAELAEAPADQIDAFYAVWVEEILESVVESLLTEYEESGKSDYFRVLYGRLCEGLTVQQVAGALELKATAVDNYYRHAKERMGEHLREVVRGHVSRYTEPGETAEEYAKEWTKLGEFLRAQGGLEEAIRRAHASRTEVSPPPALSPDLDAPPSAPE